MQHDADICIHDAINACELILEFTAGYSLQQYQADLRTKAAVEREFEIIGEALNRVHKIDSHKLESITDWRQIIQFRNVIAHGYDIVEDLRHPLILAPNCVHLEKRKLIHKIGSLYSYRPLENNRER
uniref:Uncharacterized conserved protein, contains HEPN domain n=2 Tax=Candidatus Kentrum sp. FM TaxID=2126340 RepID=A0A450TDQ2_9GAMM|nr:MAG: Uncharacterized conserved protein, contains HEPN domain [Candidatus Kentron sp. FM]